MTDETILTNAILVLPNEAIPGTLVIRDGRIADVQPGRSHALSARDLEGDHLIPGVVDVHTDNLERQVQPRQNARWPSRSAMIAHDAQCAAAGVTTVFDARCLGDLAGLDGLEVRSQFGVEFGTAAIALGDLGAVGLGAGVRGRLGGGRDRRHARSVPVEDLDRRADDTDDGERDREPGTGAGAAVDPPAEQAEEQR